MKPKLGQKIYFIWNDVSVCKDYVYALAKESFIVESYGEATEPGSWEWNYDLYGVEWFTNQGLAKKTLKERAKERWPDMKFRIIETIQGDFWELEEKE